MKLSSACEVKLVLKDLSAPYVAVDADSDQATVTITLRGDLNINIRSALAERLTEHLKQDLKEHLAQLPGSQPRQLVFDVTQVDFLDCGAAAVIFTGPTYRPGEETDTGCDYRRGPGELILDGNYGRKLEDTISAGLPSSPSLPSGPALAGTRSTVGPAKLRRAATTPPPPCWSARTALIPA